MKVQFVYVIILVLSIFTIVSIPALLVPAIIYKNTKWHSLDFATFLLQSVTLLATAAIPLVIWIKSESDTYEKEQFNKILWLLKEWNDRCAEACFYIEEEVYTVSETKNNIFLTENILEIILSSKSNKSNIYSSRWTINQWAEDLANIFDGAEKPIKLNKGLQKMLEQRARCYLFFAEPLNWAVRYKTILKQQNISLYLTDNVNDNEYNNIRIRSMTKRYYWMDKLANLNNIGYVEPTYYWYKIVGPYNIWRRDCISVLDNSKRFIFYNTPIP